MTWAEVVCGLCTRVLHSMRISTKDYLREFIKLLVHIIATDIFKCRTKGEKRLHAQSGYHTTSSW